MKDEYPFKAFVNDDSKVLILGSYPGAKSRQSDFYYADNKNRFWKILANVFDEQSPESTEEKKAFLKKHKIALWDVCKEAEVKGSNDKTLKCSKENNINKLLYSYPNIQCIMCNGGKAYKLYKQFNKDNSVKVYRVYSSSSAVNKYDKERLKQWKKYLDI